MVDQSRRARAKPQLKLGRKTRLVYLGFAALWLSLQLPGCDRRASEIKSALDTQEIAVFERGQRISTECWSCHDFYNPENRIGPYLVGVFGREAGDAGGFPYSVALSRSGIRWGEDTLRRYIAGPNTFVPGTTMVSRGIPNGPDLEALMFYMRHVTVPE